MMNDLQPVLAPKKARKLKLLPVARRLRAEGYTYREIGVALKLSDVTIREWVKGTVKGNLFEQSQT